jgi:hypothetical protein
LIALLTGSSPFSASDLIVLVTFSPARAQLHCLEQRANTVGEELCVTMFDRSPGVLMMGCEYKLQKRKKVFGKISTLNFIIMYRWQSSVTTKWFEPAKS